MTDTIDYKIQELDLSTFDHVATSAEQKNEYYDISSLISVLTSPTEINYGLIADFFLTFRSFISQKSLLEILVLRIKWSMRNINDDSHEAKQNIGKLALIRTFVMIRHWLLNYFSEDFIPSIELRQLFIESINSLTHSELFVQRIISSLKQTWTFCCNKSWDEKIRVENFYTFEIKVGPQGNKHKRLSQFALNQQNDPQTRNSIMLSTFEKNTIHKLPIPMSKREPKIVLNLKNSTYRFSKVNLPLNPIENIQNNTEILPETKPSLYKSLSSTSFNTMRSTIRDSTEFIKSPSLSKILPPTPVRKMDYIVQLPPSTTTTTTNKTQKGLRPLIEHWLKTFHVNNDTKSKQNKRAETFMKSVVSVAKVDNSKLEDLATGKFDILSARTIDELEYLVRFHNELMNKHGNKLGLNTFNESFSFTIDEAFNEPKLQKGSSNIDNMNICETISLISKSVISLQQLVESDRKSYISYDSKLSNGRIMETHENYGELKNKGKINNFKEFNFEEQHYDQGQSNNEKEEQFNETNQQQTSNSEQEQLVERPVQQPLQQAEQQQELQQELQNELQQEDQSDIPPSTNEIITPTSSNYETNGIENTEREEVNGSKNIRNSLRSIAFSILSESTPNHADVESNADIETHNTTPEVDTAAESFMNQLKSPGPSSISSNDQLLESESTEQPLNDGEEELKREIVETKEELSPSRYSVGSDSDYEDIESFVSTYDEVEDMVSGSHETGINQSDLIDEPSTPPLLNDGLISSTPQISPIKPITENVSKKDIKNEDSTSPIAQNLDLNRVPSFTRVSNSSITKEGILVSNDAEESIDRHSYLSKRSNIDHKKSQASQGSVNSIFSSTARNLVNVSIKHKSQFSSLNQDKPLQTSSLTISENDESLSLMESINSDEYNVPYPGVDSDVIAELAAITDDSIIDDPISAALLKLEGSYVKRNKELASKVEDDSPLISSANTSELSKQVESLGIHSTPKKVKRNSVFIDQRRKTKLFSLTPVKQKTISYEETSSRIMLDLLLRRKITNDILQITNNEQHISFILNFNSKTLAEQFTLIEKDALLEIDWKELVDLKWDSNQLVPINSWLELLVQNQEIRGVDLCISRFNLTVNWIISEILLTKDITLRKLTIQRFIHIAQNCKSLQNYSTLMQILLALGSDKIMKLKDTWRIIEPGDILIYKNLENISSPLKNFIVLRNELNKIKPSLGCVPFLGLYLSDLVFNKEKRSTNGNQINFGKFKHDSKIVRSLIQCIQWSTLYRLKANDEVLSKCLYIKALTEDEMNECLDLILKENTVVSA